MASDKQIAANIQNAQFSKGPRTEHGKARSSRNALRDGFYSKALIILPGLESEFELLRSQMLNALQPEPGIQDAVFDEIDRVLTPGGRLQIADVIVRTGIAGRHRGSRSAWLSEILTRYPGCAKLARPGRDRPQSGRHLDGCPWTRYADRKAANPASRYQRPVLARTEGLFALWGHHQFRTVVPPVMALRADGFTRGRGPA